MRRKVDSKLIITITSCMLAIFSSLLIAYSALQEQIKVETGNVNKESLTWQIGFKEETVTGVATNGSTNTSCGTATATSKKLSISNINLTNKSEKCTFELTIVNSGNINAKIGEITPVTPDDTTCSTQNGSTLVCGNITYLLRYDSSTSTNYLQVNDNFNANTSTKVYLTAEYTGTILAANDFIQNNFGYTITFNQN